VECWTLCGKADNLVSASDKACRCKGDIKVEREIPAPEEKPVEIFDWLLK
jgi:hypothetical protein